MTITELIGINTLENSRIEFKLRLNREDAEGWLKTVAGFSNASGGIIYIGVEDKTGKLEGFDSKDADNERNYFNNTVNQHIFPNPTVMFRFIPYEIREKQLFLIEVTIKESPVKPVILKYHNVPSIYMRRDGYTNGATYEEIFNMCRKNEKARYDSIISDIRYSRTDYKKLLAFHKEKTGGKELTDKALQSMGFFNNDGYLTNGALLFRDDYSGGKTTVQCSVYSGFTRGSNRIDNIRKFSGDITETINYAVSFVMENSTHSIIKLSDRHIDLYSYPARSLMEGIVNAVAHRDYFLDGTQIDITVFRNRLEITSPGGFYGSSLDGRVDNLEKLMSVHRNEIICAVLVKCDVMEASGTGFEKIMEDYSDADEAHKPYADVRSDHFTLVLPDLTYSGGVDDKGFRMDNESDLEKRIAVYCAGSARSVLEIASYMKMSNSSYLRNILNEMEKKKYLSSVKRGRAKYYTTDVTAVE